MILLFCNLYLVNGDWPRSEVEDLSRKRLRTDGFSVCSRSKPGLRPQHLTGLRLIKALSEGSLSGGHVGSDTVVLEPAALLPGDFQGDTGTAGSCTLLAQASQRILTLLPCCLSQLNAQLSSRVQPMLICADIGRWWSSVWFCRRLRFPASC